MVENGWLIGGRWTEYIAWAQYWKWSAQVSTNIITRIRQMHIGTASGIRRRLDSARRRECEYGKESVPFCSRS